MEKIFLRGTFSASSEMDILVVFEKSGAIFGHFMELIFYLRMYSKNPIDLVTPSSISPYMKHEIDREIIWCEGGYGCLGGFIIWGIVC